jgi:hypothetical protein
LPILASNIAALFIIGALAFGGRGRSDSPRGFAYIEAPPSKNPESSSKSSPSSSSSSSRGINSNSIRNSRNAKNASGPSSNSRNTSMRSPSLAPSLTGHVQDSQQPPSILPLFEDTNKSETSPSLTPSLSPSLSLTQNLTQSPNHNFNNNGPSLV